MKKEEKIKEENTDKINIINFCFQKKKNLVQITAAKSSLLRNIDLVRHLSN